jgi:hypothetical protein
MPAAPNVSFGVIVEINRQPVALMADGAALEKMKKEGLDLNLPGPVSLGQVGKDMAELDKMVKGLFPDAPSLPSTDSLPDPIQQILKGISTLNLRVDDLRIHIPPPGGKVQDFRYALRIAAEWLAQDEKKLGPITIKGFAFGVESPKDGADGSPAKSK